MLSDYLDGECRHSVMDGVKIYKIFPGHTEKGIYDISEDKKEQLDVFFCFEGSFLLGRNKNPPMRIGSHEIVIISGMSDVKTFQVFEDITGYCVSINTKVFKNDLADIFVSLGIDKSFCKKIPEMMSIYDGCIRIHSTPWSRCAFSIMRSLPFKDQGSYCLMKIIELLYLICSKNALLEGTSDLPPSLGYSPRTISSVRSYMESHLDEKMTIPVLSRKFNISSTALKNGFKELYGLPLHTWLQSKRAERAAELLSLSNLTVIQISQSVGYEGVSQFNVIFKRQYGVTPMQYRKMSEPVRI